MAENFREVYRELVEAGYTDVVTYMVQNIVSYRKQGEDFAMQHAQMDSLDHLWQLLATDYPDVILGAMSAEKRLRGLSPEDRVRGLSPEDRLSGLSPEERRRLAEMILRTQPGDPN